MSFLSIAMKECLAYIVASVIVLFARFVTAVRGIWAGIEPSEQQRVYLANHTSHGDLVLIWTVLPPRLRRKSRPVAGTDYWRKTPLRRFVGEQVFKAVLINRTPKTRKDNPIAVLTDALDEGASLIDIPGFAARNQRLIVFLVIVVQSSNVLEEVWGKLYGGKKIAPKLSPSKTIEGFVIGALGAACLGACLSWITPFTFMQAGFLSLIIATAGLFGSLVMLAIKRDRGVKDWGHMIPGHGGFIDQFDAVIFSAPLFFHLVRYGWSLS